MNVLQKENSDVLRSYEEMTLLTEISNESECQENGILNTTMYGMKDVTDYLLNKNYNLDCSTEFCITTNISLHSAVMLNNVQLIKKLLNKEPSISAIDRGNNTPLHLAFMLGYDEVTDLILNYIREACNYINLKNKYGLSHLHIASARGNAFITQKFIEAGGNVDEFVNEDSLLYAGYTALRFACAYKRVETIKVLTKASSLHGTTIDEDTNNMPHDNLELFKNLTKFLINLQQNEESNCIPNFHLACFKDNLTIVKDLLEKNEDINALINRNSRANPLFTPLHMAIEGETEWKNEKVKLLLQEGANIDGRNGFCMTALHLAMYNHIYKDKSKDPLDKIKEDETLKLVYTAMKNKQANLMDCNGLTYFHIAVTMNDFQLVKKFLNSGENINQPVLKNLRQFSTYTPLHFAVKYGHENMAKLLINRGADVNANNDDPQFDTPLQLAIKYGHHRLIDLLLKNKANAKVIQKNGKKTTLHLLAERFGKTKINTSAGLEEKGELQNFAYKFVRLGVDVDAIDSESSTALHIACSKMYDSIHLVNWLLMVGADIDVKNDDNETPFGVACGSGFRGNYNDFLMLYLHVQKLKDLKLKIDEKNEKFCRLVMKRKIQWMNNDDWITVERSFSKQELDRKKQERLCEIEKLKVDMVTENISLYDYVKMDGKQAAEYVENEKLKKIVDQDAWDEYEVYGYLIPTVYRKSLKWLASQKS
ncbi:ankyrin-1-like isoform X2 [Phymastichus coffea]|nr:ankyrin-1-like isoform X2 [Phymastichus coffea]